MIIKGNVLTNQGPKPIEKIQEGDIVINLGNRPCRVVKVEEADMTEVIRFASNPHLVIARDTDIATRYGRVQGRSITGSTVEEMLYQCEAPCFYDTMEPGKLDRLQPGYELTVDSGDGVFVDGYGIYVKKEGERA